MTISSLINRPSWRDDSRRATGDSNKYMIGMQYNTVGSSNNNDNSIIVHTI